MLSRIRRATSWQLRSLLLVGVCTLMMGTIGCGGGGEEDDGPPSEPVTEPVTEPEDT